MTNFSNTSAKKFVFNDERVADAKGAALIVRTHLESAALRELIVSHARHRERACEIGAGYGRMTQSLPYYFDQVDAFEREPKLIEVGSKLCDQFNFIGFESVKNIPSPNSIYDFVLTFTFMQHLDYDEVRQLSLEINRILRPGGILIACEETDRGTFNGYSSYGLLTLGRSISEYSEILKPLELIGSRPRPREPNYPRLDVGQFIIFSKSS